VSVVITGAHGFLGWHVRVVAHANSLVVPHPLGRGDEDRLVTCVAGADRVVHLAGVNRGTPAEVVLGNTRAASALAHAIRTAPTPPKTVVFANSIQSGNSTPYGDAKATSAAILADATQWSGSTFVDIQLPNVYGEHGRPHYNSVVATFCRALADGLPLEVHEDREMELVHATDAATWLLGLDQPAPFDRLTVTQIATRLTTLSADYRDGRLPELADRLDLRLFNTLRSHRPPAAIPLPRHTDARGELVEAVLSPGRGQTFYSSTVPGQTRGQHYHLAKVERFVVQRGEAEIRLRRLFFDEVVRVRATGVSPIAVDMPTMWAHSITNVGTGELSTLFWANELYDPQRPDTHPEQVE